jgi:alpha-L-fucosidase
MNNRNIQVQDYRNLMDFFNPTAFDAKELVSLAKKSGMKYITFITRHHDGFSLWNTKYSDFNIMNTPYKKDIVKMLADECHKQGIKLFFYYSLLDWSRNDYPYETGKTGKKLGRTTKSNYDSYLQFMKNQLTELLTNYGKIDGIWFDGHWDQVIKEGEVNTKSKIDWKYDEIYSLIHKLQPWCLIGNNHHINPIDGEDFQMFERDLPGENKAGYSPQAASMHLPLETCETLNGSWGYNITDRKFKSTAQVVKLLVGAAGRNANLLLNIGPMPNGKIQQQFVDTLSATGQWLAKYGETIYGTRGDMIKPQKWGVVTLKDNIVYVHLLENPTEGTITLPNFNAKIKSITNFDDNQKVKYTFDKKTSALVLTTQKDSNQIDKIIKIQLK